MPCTVHPNRVTTEKCQINSAQFRSPILPIERRPTHVFPKFELLYAARVYNGGFSLDKDIAGGPGAKPDRIAARVRIQDAFDYTTGFPRSVRERERERERGREMGRARLAGEERRMREGGGTRGEGMHILTLRIRPDSYFIHWRPPDLEIFLKHTTNSL
ncbi:hypothetical protein MIMGU_mgv1a015425mg [Erythranthe guttata]|uniref:Uncharacterized protein n=1 Tax=Erythranthe guttata TaxID=4155 RepID=A0A022PUL1_ERYGU|nr:hypothetical protein MIMGU_mgv1a015425mg [Erythranthe guttata]